MGHFLEVDGNFRLSFCKTFSGPKIKGNALPAPVIDENFHRSIGRRPRLPGNALFIAVPGTALPLDCPRSVLAEHDMVVETGRAEISAGTEVLSPCRPERGQR